MKKSLKYSFLSSLWLSSLVGSFFLGEYYQKNNNYKAFIEKLDDYEISAEDNFDKFDKPIYATFVKTDVKESYEDKENKRKINGNLEFIIKELDNQEQKVLIECDDGNDYLVKLKGNKGFLEQVKD